MFENAPQGSRLVLSILSQALIGTRIRDPTAQIRRMRAAPLSFVPPQLPTLVEAPPASAGWVHEVKHDGFRMQLVIESQRVRIYSRAGLDWTDRFAHIARAAAGLARSAIIDGEMVVQDERGASDFSALRGGRGSPVFIAFDLLHWNARDLRKLPLTERRAKLATLVGGHPLIGFSDAWTGTAAQLLAAAEANGLEGIVSKRSDGVYCSGRSKGWVKTKCWTESILTLIGFDKDSAGIPIALLARDGSDGLEYAGGALVGLPKEVRAAVERLPKRARAPIAGVRQRRRATWLDPTLRLRIRHLRGSDEIRHATVSGLA